MPPGLLKDLDSVHCTCIYDSSCRRSEISGLLRRQASGQTCMCVRACVCVPVFKEAS